MDPLIMLLATLKNCFFDQKKPRRLSGVAGDASLDSLNLQPELDLPIFRSVLLL